MMSPRFVAAVLTPVSSSVPVLAADSRISAKSSAPPTSIPVTACVTKRVSSRARTFSANARPTCTPTGVEPSGTSFPMLYRMTLGWLMSLRTIASTSASHQSANRNA